MEKLKAGIEFIFSSYKRSATVLFIAALTLAIPITLSLLSQRQDIRQRAAGTDQVCAQVITSAYNPATSECRDFPTPCDVPAGWSKVSSCKSFQKIPESLKRCDPNLSGQCANNQSCVNGFCIASGSAGSVAPPTIPVPSITVPSITVPSITVPSISVPSIPIPSIPPILCSKYRLCVGDRCLELSPPVKCVNNQICYNETCIPLIQPQSSNP